MMDMKFKRRQFFNAAALLGWFKRKPSTPPPEQIVVIRYELKPDEPMIRTIEVVRNKRSHDSD
jgi:hypothetical protein